MKLVAKTMEKVVYEVTPRELEDEFDSIWDRIRETYSKEEFEVFSITPNVSNDDIVFIELTPKKLEV